MISTAIRRGIDDIKNKPIKENNDDALYKDVARQLGIDISEPNLSQNSYYKETKSEIIDRSRRFNIPLPSYKYFKSDTKSDLVRVVSPNINMNRSGSSHTLKSVEIPNVKSEHKDSGSNYQKQASTPTNNENSSPILLP